MFYQEKYLKYKNKYLKLKQIGGDNLTINEDIPDPAPEKSGVYANKNYTSITIGPKVTRIGSYAFYGNKLTSVTFESPSSLKSIGKLAFGKNKLTSVTIPSSVTSIGNKAFYNNELTSVTIPSSITSIEESAFEINQLTSVTFESPSSLTRIEDRAFATNQLGPGSVTIPSSVTSIGSNVFINQMEDTKAIALKDAQIKKELLEKARIKRQCYMLGMNAKHHQKLQ